MFFHSVFRMNSKFSTFSTIVRIGCWGEDRFFSRWLRVSGRISFLLAAAIGYEGSFLLNFVSLLNLVFSFRPSAIWIWRRRGAWWAFFAHGFPRIAERGLRSLRVWSPLRLPETLPLDVGIGISNRYLQSVPKISRFFSCWCVRAAGKTSPLDVATQVFNPPMNS